MTADIAAITFSCREPRKVAAFWAQILGREVAATAGEESAAVLADIPIFFRRGESDTAIGSDLHIDLSTEDLDAEATRLLGLGATEVRRNRWHATESITFVDIEGNQFDLVAD